MMASAKGKEGYGGSGRQEQEEGGREMEASGEEAGEDPEQSDEAEMELEEGSETKLAAETLAASKIAELKAVGVGFDGVKAQVIFRKIEAVNMVTKNARVFNSVGDAAREIGFPAGSCSSFELAGESSFPQRISALEVKYKTSR